MVKTVHKKNKALWNLELNFIITNQKQNCVLYKSYLLNAAQMPVLNTMQKTNQRLQKKCK